MCLTWGQVCSRFLGASRQERNLWVNDSKAAGGGFKLCQEPNMAPYREKISGEHGGTLLHTGRGSILGQWGTSGFSVRSIQTFKFTPFFSAEPSFLRVKYYLMERSIWFKSRSLINTAHKIWSWRDTDLTHAEERNVNGLSTCGCRS